MEGILELLHIGIKKSLKQDQTENNDGMDVCLCRLIKQETGKTNITYAGAKRPLFYFKKQNSQIFVLKGDKRAVGGARAVGQEIPFTNYEFTLKQGDTIYLSSDGIIDQNNPEGKRIGSRKFKEMLRNAGLLSLNEQKQYLERLIDNHQQNAEQRDDIALLGIKL